MPTSTDRDEERPRRSTLRVSRDVLLPVTGHSPPTPLTVRCRRVRVGKDPYGLEVRIPVSSPLPVDLLGDPGFVGRGTVAGFGEVLVVTLASLHSGIRNLVSLSRLIPEIQWISAVGLRWSQPALLNHKEKWRGIKIYLPSDLDDLPRTSSVGGGSWIYYTVEQAIPVLAIPVQSHR